MFISPLPATGPKTLDKVLKFEIYYGKLLANSFPDKIISISKSFGGFGLGQIKQNYGPFGRKQCPLNEKTLIWESSSTPALGMLFVIGVQNFKYDMG